MDYCDVELERALALSLGETQGHAADRTPQRGALKEGSDSKDDLRYRRSSSREGSAHQARSSSTEPIGKGYKHDEGRIGTPENFFEKRICAPKKCLERGIDASETHVERGINTPEKRLQ
jgi:hypothetical protein